MEWAFTMASLTLSGDVCAKPNFSLPEINVCQPGQMLIKEKDHSHNYHSQHNCNSQLGWHTSLTSPRLA